MCNTGHRRSVAVAATSPVGTSAVRAGRAQTALVASAGIHTERLARGTAAQESPPYHAVRNVFQNTDWGAVCLLRLSGSKRTARPRARVSPDLARNGTAQENAARRARPLSPTVESNHARAPQGVRCGTRRGARSSAAWPSHVRRSGDPGRCLQFVSTISSAS